MVTTFCSENSHCGLLLGEKTLRPSICFSGDSFSFCSVGVVSSPSLVSTTMSPKVFTHPFISLHTPTWYPPSDPHDKSWIRHEGHPITSRFICVSGTPRTSPLEDHPELTCPKHSSDYSPKSSHFSGAWAPKAGIPDLPPIHLSLIPSLPTNPAPTQRFYLLDAFRTVCPFLFLLPLLCSTSLSLWPSLRKCKPHRCLGAHCPTEV